MPRRRWIRSSLDESRWWVAIILAAIAVARTPPSTAFTIVAWCVAIAWLAVCLFWDFFRWHWPFLPVEVERHIKDGQRLLGGCDKLALKNWQSQGEAMIGEIWGSKSAQLRSFIDAGAVDSVLEEQFHADVILRRQIRALKWLDPTA